MFAWFFAVFDVGKGFVCFVLAMVWKKSEISHGGGKTVFTVLLIIF